MSLLNVQHIDTGYSKKQVLFDINFEVEEKQTLLIIGSNGSGKSTLLKAIFGILPLWNGEIRFNGELLHNSTFKTQTSKLVSKGLMYVPQKNELFENMTVEQNLSIALIHLNDKKESQKRIKNVFSQLKILENLRSRVANRLSGGERKLLSIGMVLANKPKLLLCDEPLAGLGGGNIAMVLNNLQEIKATGTTLIIIEHKIREMLNVADKVVGLKLGRTNTETLADIETIKSFMI